MTLIILKEVKKKKDLNYQEYPLFQVAAIVILITDHPKKTKAIITRIWREWDSPPEIKKIKSMRVHHNLSKINSSKQIIKSIL
jgi:hypothetical protein